MRTDKDLLLKSIKYLFYTVLLLFLAPVVLYQAFKNQDHPFYIPVLILGGILAVAAIAMGFISIGKMVTSVFGPKK